MKQIIENNSNYHKSIKLDYQVWCVYHNLNYSWTIWSIWQTFWIGFYRYVSDYYFYILKMLALQVWAYNSTDAQWISGLTPRESNQAWGTAQLWSLISYSKPELLTGDTATRSRRVICTFWQPLLKMPLLENIDTHTRQAGAFNILDLY